MAALGSQGVSLWNKVARMNVASPNTLEIFRPPINRSMRVLDRSLFEKVVPISAATIFDKKNIGPTRQKLSTSGDIFGIDGRYPVPPIQDDDSRPNTKCILLQPNNNANDSESWPPIIQELVKQQIAKIRPFDLKLTYDDWTTHDILDAVLPEVPEQERDLPSGFASVGHVAHVNLQNVYLPYRHLIGQVIIDKNPNIRTVINKTEDVGTESIFRTFPYEVLAGPDDMDVIVSESDCQFQFNYAKVYWNSRLHTEHKRLFDKFNEGDTVCDVMAGVGPFAIPAGKNKVFVWANDLNPDSFAGLEWAIAKNKVGKFVNASCADGRDFIRRATSELPMKRRRARVEKQKLKPLPRNATQEQKIQREKDNTIVIDEPPTFNHYVMNLPATAVEFLDAFKGVYAGKRTEFLPYSMRFLPMVHVYLFTPRRDNAEEEQVDVCERVSTHLGHNITPKTPDVELFDVRLVSPKKRMYCASFRLPPEVAFAEDKAGKPRTA